MADKICTHCGYEGKAIKRPRDDAGEERSETKSAFDRLARSAFLLTGIPVKPLAILLVIPVYVALWPFKKLLKDDGPKHCPNCGLPLMVSLKSDAGWMARRKNDIKSGAVVIVDGKAHAAGSAIARAATEVQNAPEPTAAKPEKLPSLDAMLAPAHQPAGETPENTGAQPPDTAEKPPEIKKPRVDPDAW